MKKFISTLVLATSFSAFAAAEYAQINIDWSDRFLSEGLALICDDTFYSGVELTIPGTYKYGVENDISFKDCPASTRILSKKKVIENGVEKMKVRIKVKDSCEMDIKQEGRDGKVFNVSISDAC